MLCAFWEPAQSCIFSVLHELSPDCTPVPHGMVEDKLCETLNSRVYKPEESLEAEGRGSPSPVVTILQPSKKNFKKGLSHSSEALMWCGMWRLPGYICQLSYTRVTPARALRALINRPGPARPGPDRPQLGLFLQPVPSSRWWPWAEPSSICSHLVAYSAL